MTTAPQSLVGLDLDNGRYHVTGHVGEGGMATIYRATDRTKNREVVLKVPKPALLADPEFAQRFAREIRTLVELKHPAVVGVLGFARHEGLPICVLQYMAGGCLDDQPKPSKVAGLRKWLPDVAAALDHIHAAGFVHRDVKPANILFDAQGKARLSDFGIIKSVHEKSGSTQALTSSGVAVGTPEYMAPELAKGDDFDGKVDQYALAISVYEMVAGRRPFEAKSGAALLVKQIQEQPTALDEVVAGVPAALSNAVAQALAKDPRRRFVSCAEFVRAALTGALAAKATPTRNAAATIPSVATPSGGKIWKIALGVAGVALLSVAAIFTAKAAFQTSEKKDAPPTPPPIVVTPPPAPPVDVPMPPNTPPVPVGKKGKGKNKAVTPRPKVTFDAIDDISLERGATREISVFVQRHDFEGPLPLTAIMPFGIRAEPAVPVIPADESAINIKLTASAAAVGGVAQLRHDQESVQFNVRVGVPIVPAAMPTNERRIGRMTLQIAALEFLPGSDSSLVAWDTYPRLNVWNVASGTRAGVSVIGGEFVRGAVSPDGSQAITATRARIFEHNLAVSTIKQLSSGPHNHTILGLCYSGRIPQVHTKWGLSPANNPNQVGRDELAKNATVMKYSTAGKRVSLQDDGAKVLWRIGGTRNVTIDPGNATTVFNLNHEGDMAVTFVAGKLSLWGADKPDTPRPGFPKNYTDVTAVAVSRDGRQIALGFRSGELRLLNVTP